MRRFILAVLAIAGATFVFSGTQASAFGWWRPNDPVHAFYCYRGPRWDYSAAYYQSYRHHRRSHGRACGCR
jgi:hypothetical protein